ncbi:hypothetical protein FBT96_05535 [Rhodobacter capsulatus]|uniref:CRISPR system Cascade subunit CasB n=1 Tax=Rhodobacter capsulatus TaxID=1061 RepID=A0A4U1JVR9_RHOCA|nr:type I-E CRISPR-associated protein Cse2/CasB [Rhodobacter capsulatus]TKD22773.1 hypothetical protein FBT96_05535 [Rhodobacter capsulatus]
MSEDTDETARRALAIAKALGQADPGDKAAARRMGPEGAPVFWRQVARLEIAPGQEALWLRFTRSVALLTPASETDTIHAAGRKLGAVLADGGNAGAAISAETAKPVISEQRLARLLAMRGEARAEALERMIRMIARARPRLDVVSLARAFLNPASDRLARDYYTRLDHSPQQERHDA